MRKKPVRRGMSGVKMVRFGVRMTLSEAQHVVLRTREEFDGNLSAYIRSLVHRDKWGKQDKAQEPN